jgi:hypothetical protein
MRSGGPFAGADRVVAHARARGQHVYTSTAGIPAAG